MLRKISEVLIESKNTRRQIQAGYFQTEHFGDYTKEIVGYCAMGALACEAGMARLLDNSEYGEHDAAVLAKFGVLDDLRKPTKCPFCDGVFSKLHNMIVHLNDAEDKDFKEIGEVIKIFEENGTIVPIPEPK